MSIFIEKNLEIDINEKINNIIINNIKDEKVYRFFRYNKNIQIICFLKEKFNNDILERNFEMMDSDILLINNLLNVKNILDNLKYHLQINVNGTYFNILHNKVNMNKIYNLLFKELFKKNFTSLQILNLIFNSCDNISTVNKEYILKNYIKPSIIEYFSTNNIEDIYEFLEDIYIPSNDLFTNIFYIELINNIQTKILNTNIFQDNSSKILNYHKWLSINSYYLEYDVFNDSFLSLDIFKFNIQSNIKNIYKFLILKNNSNVNIEISWNKEIKYMYQIESNKSLELNNLIYNNILNIIVKQIQENNLCNIFLNEIDNLITNNNYENESEKTNYIYDNLEQYIFIISLFLNNKYNTNFKELYITKLKKRNNINNYFKFEKIACILFDKYLNDTNKDFIKLLNDILNDYELNIIIKNEFNNQLYLKYNKNYNYLNIYTFTNNLWKEKFLNGLVINPREDIYSCNIIGQIINDYKKYYDVKFKNNRKLAIYGNKGKVNFNLKTNTSTINISANIIQFIILDFIIKYQSTYTVENLFNEIKKYLNIFSNELKKEIDLLIDNNLIFYKDNKYILNDLDKLNPSYNLIKS